MEVVILQKNLTTFFNDKSMKERRKMSLVFQKKNVSFNR